MGCTILSCQRAKRGGRYHLSIRGKAARGDFDRASVVLNSDMTQIVQNTN